MSVTTNWAPNQAAIAQVETVTLVGAPSTGNTFSAAINGKVVTYTALSTDTVATFATGLYNLLNVSTSVAPELTEIQFANPSAGVITATAKVPGTPFANVPGTTAGLVFSTGNGYSGTCTTVHTQANQSPSDVNDAQNWQRVNLANTPPSKTRALPQSTDDVVVANTSVPLLWNLDQLAAVQFNTYNRWQSFTGTVGLPENNPGGYSEWRATYFKFSGPVGSAPVGGLQAVLGYGAGAGPSRERYDVGSSPTTFTVLAAGQAADDYGVRLLGVHTNNTITIVGPVSVGVAMLPGEKANLNTVTLDGGGTIGIGAGVTWTTAISGATSALTTFGGSAILNSAPAAVVGSGGTQFTVATDALTWASFVVQGGCQVSFLAGGTITTLTMSNGCALDKSQDARSLVITNSTLDGDTCFINDPLNSVSFTNATSVKQTVQQGPIRFTGTRTLKVV